MRVEFCVRIEHGPSGVFPNGHIQTFWHTNQDEAEREARVLSSGIPETYKSVTTWVAIQSQ